MLQNETLNFFWSPFQTVVPPHLTVFTLGESESCHVQQREQCILHSTQQFNLASSQAYHQSATTLNGTQ